MNWQHHTKIKHLFTRNEDHESVQKSMSAIADVLDADTWFHGFDRSLLKEMRNIPAGDRYFGPVDYANQLLSSVYDYADDNSIWIE